MEGVAGEGREGKGGMDVYYSRDFYLINFFYKEHKDSLPIAIDYT